MRILPLVLPFRQILIKKKKKLDDVARKGNYLKNVISLFNFLQYHSNVIIHLISSSLIEKVLVRDYSFLIFVF